MSVQTYVKFRLKVLTEDPCQTIYSGSDLACTGLTQSRDIIADPRAGSVDANAATAALTNQLENSSTFGDKETCREKPGYVTKTERV
jgi:hypothetical protein